MKQTRDLLYPATLRARAPRQLVDAVEAAAQRDFMSAGQFIRETLLKRLREDGMLLPETSRNAA
jgi:hypothetical protein